GWISQHGCTCCRVSRAARCARTRETGTATRNAEGLARSGAAPVDLQHGTFATGPVSRGRWLLHVEARHGLPLGAEGRRVARRSDRGTGTPRNGSPVCGEFVPGATPMPDAMTPTWRMLPFGELSPIDVHDIYQARVAVFV